MSDTSDASFPSSKMRLNGICPYFTMFPLEFPLTVLREHAEAGQVLVDPFCGRGTSNFAARLMGISSFGIDSSPVATAISQAKLSAATPHAIERALAYILRHAPEPKDVPQGEFWEWSFAPKTLIDLCKIREALLISCRTDARIALRGIILGALHGPVNKTGKASYLSNQSPRTYAPKPAYAVRFWRARNMNPPEADIKIITSLRAARYYGDLPNSNGGKIIQADSRDRSAFRVSGTARAHWIITSPPYYGMRTYIPDQWLRNWFVGGPAKVDYSNHRQLEHKSPAEFSRQLRQVWVNAARRCHPGARLVIRFGGINNRKADPESILLESLQDAPWRLESLSSAGIPANNRRQSSHFLKQNASPIEEFDLCARLL